MVCVRRFRSGRSKNKDEPKKQNESQTKPVHGGSEDGIRPEAHRLRHDLIGIMGLAGGNVKG